MAAIINSCGADCSEDYGQDTQVTLTATADPGNSFGGWSGACTGMAATCTVSMTQAQEVTATFIVGPSYALNVLKSGNGLGTVTSTPAGIGCGIDCSEIYPSGTSVELTVSVEPNSTFVGWTGACSGAGSCTVIMTSDKEVTAIIDKLDEPKVKLYLPLILNNSSNITGQVSIEAVATSKGLPKKMLLKRKIPGGGYLLEYSLDSGKTFQPVGNGPWAAASVEQLHIALSPKTDGPLRIVAAVTAPGATGVYRTGDFGANWATIDLFSTTYPDLIFSEMVSSPADPTRVYLVGSTDASGGSGWSSSYFSSADSGITWKLDGTYAGVTVQNLTSSPVNADKVYFLEKTWHPNNLPVLHLAADAIEPLWIYGIDGTSGRSNDDGLTWNPWVNPPCDTGQLLAHPTKSQVLLLLCDQGLFRSMNGGDDWDKLTSVNAGFIQPDYGNPGRLIWVKGNDLFVSCDDGGQWVAINPGCSP